MIINEQLMKPVTIYSTPFCGFCKMTKEFLKQHNVAYTDHDVSTDAAKAEEMMEKSGQLGVPVILIGEGKEQEMIIGFDQAKLSQALGI